MGVKPRYSPDHKLERGVERHSGMHNRLVPGSSPGGPTIADVAKLVDASRLGRDAEKHESSSLSIRTIFILRAV